MIFYILEVLCFYVVGFFFFNIICNCCEIGFFKIWLVVFDILFEKFWIILFELKIFDWSDVIVFWLDGMFNRKKIYLFFCVCFCFNFFIFIVFLCYVGISENIFWFSLVELLWCILIYFFWFMKFEVIG